MLLGAVMVSIEIFEIMRKLRLASIKSAQSLFDSNGIQSKNIFKEWSTNQGEVVRSQETAQKYI